MTARDDDQIAAGGQMLLLLAAVADRAALDAAGQMESGIIPQRRPDIAAAAACWLTWARRELAPLADAGDIRGPRVDPEAGATLLALEPW